MKLTRDPNARSEFKKNTEQLDKFQSGMEELQATPNKNFKGTKAAYIYKQLVVQLKEQGFVKELDMHLVNLLAMHIDIYYTAYKEISEHGIQQAIYKPITDPNTGEVLDRSFQGYKANPAVNTLNMSTNQIKTISDKLGLDPRSRASMLANIKTEEDDEPSLSDLLNKGGSF